MKHQKIKPGKYLEKKKKKKRTCSFSHLYIPTPLLLNYVHFVLKLTSPVPTKDLKHNVSPPSASFSLHPLSLPKKMENIGDEYKNYWETNMFLQNEELDRYINFHFYYISSGLSVQILFHLYFSFGAPRNDLKFA